MLEVGKPVGDKSCGESVTFTEPANVLERVLQFIYPQVIPTFEVDFPMDDHFVEALFKYEIVRGLEFVGNYLKYQQLQRGTMAPVLADLGWVVRALRSPITSKTPNSPEPTCCRYSTCSGIRMTFEVRLSLWREFLGGSRRTWKTDLLLTSSNC